MNREQGKTKMNTHPNQRELDYIAACGDPLKLRTIAKHARKQGNTDVEKAASLRLYAVLPVEDPGTLEHDVWQSIHALEHSLSNERGKTVRLGRTRNSITKFGEQNTVAKLLLKPKASEGFAMLMERGMPERTFEAVALKHAVRFNEEELEAASTRLLAAGQLPKSFQ
jgi:hypothetical protein